MMRYEVVVFSNQSRITFDVKGKLFPQWKQKLQAIAETVNPWNPLLRSKLLLAPFRLVFFVVLYKPELSCFVVREGLMVA
jgi:hypothetical protein